MEPISIAVAIISLIATAAGVYYARQQYRITQAQKLAPEIPKPALEKPEETRLEALPSSEEDYSSYKRWLRSETLYIDIRGIAVASKPGKDAITFPIVDLYAELYVQRGPTNLHVDDGRMRSIRLTDLVDNTRCALITGDPGAGKTTLLRYLAQKNLSIPTSRYKIQTDDHLPIYIYLPDLYKHLQLTVGPFTKGSLLTRLSPSTLVEFVVALSEKHNLGLTKANLMRAIQTGQVLWLLDSLDELTATDSREAIVDLLTTCSREFENCKFVVTSRPLVVKGNSIPLDFQVVNIDYMQPEEIRSFLEKWFLLLYPDKAAEARREASNKLFDKIVNTPHLRLLAKNPVMLTSIAVLDYNSMALPERKVDLLEAIISWLVTAKIRDAREKVPGLKESIYAKLACKMFEHPTGRQLQVGRRWAASAIAEHFDDENAALDFLSKEENETGLLVQRGEGDLAFWLTWFQEYLAAKEIVNSPDFGRYSWWAKIKDRLDDPDWHEVLSMVPACLNRLGSNRVNLFFERLGKSCAKCDFQHQVRRVGFGGRVLRDLFLNQYRLTGAPKWNAALANVSVIFSDTSIEVDLKDKYEAAAAIGQVPGSLNSDLAGWIQFEGGDFLMGAQANDARLSNYDKNAFDWEGPIIEIHLAPFDIQKCPTSVEEFAGFVEAGGYRQRELWREDGWAWRVKNKIREPLDWQSQVLMPNCPITGLSWFEAFAYCEWLSLKSGRTFRYSLPSEAQWEFSYRSSSGSDHRFSWGDALSRGSQSEANWLGCELRRKSPIGMFPKSNTSNGLVDMIGNVEEWCADNWNQDHSGYDHTGRARVVEGSVMCIVRGGSTIRPAKHCRPTYRSRTSREKRYQTIGFRPVRIANS